MIRKLKDFFEIELMANALSDINLTLESVELESEAEEFTNKRVVKELVCALNNMLRDDWELRLELISIFQREFPNYHLKIQREIKKILEEEGDEII